MDAFDLNEELLKLQQQESAAAECQPEYDDSEVSDKLDGALQRILGYH